MPDINYTSVPTAIGLTKLTNAAILKKPLNLTTVKLGDSNGVEYTPDGSESGLKNVVYTGAVNAAEAHKDVESWAEIEVIIPQDQGPFWVREMGIYDSDGDLIFVSAIAPRFKPEPAATTVDISIVMIVDLVKPGAINLVADPHTTIATRAWV